MLIPLVLVAALSSCRANRVTGAMELGLISESTEIELGRSAAPDIEEEYGGLCPDPLINACVEEVGRKIASVSHCSQIDCRFRVLNSSVVNAFALPGGLVYITRGLLAKLTDESQLAAVLAHEVAHISAGDGTQRISKTMNTNALLAAGVATAASKSAKDAREKAAAVSIAGNILSSSASNGYGREAEEHADALGAEYVVRAGYPPQGITKAMELFQSLRSARVPGVEEFFRSHPTMERRVDEVTKEIRKRFPDLPNIPLADNEEEFRRRMSLFTAKNKAYDKFDEAKRARAVGQLARALQLVNEALAIQGESPLFLGERAAVYLAMNDDRSAEADERRARELAPPTYDGRIGWGILLLRKGDFPEAEKEFEAAVDLRPAHHLGHYYLAESRYRMRKMAAAAEGFRTVLDRTEENPYVDDARRRLKEIGGN
ncbi:MAG: hypothetical protein A2Z34_03455 [Planctomycetes bacterium RBG_16_59_8]|nr:MAG: hypothetical protein A2Z34_03455 [Planctomycetes bacterium RBG_16_59_8]